MSFDLDTPQLFDLPEIRDDRGVSVLGYLQPGLNCPFPIERVYYIYDVPVGTDRGHHAHHKSHRVMVALAGAVEVDLELNDANYSFTLDSRGKGLFVPAPAWIVYRSLVEGSVLMALASEKYDESDYIRNYDDFKKS